MAGTMTYICPTCGAEARVGRPCPGCKPAKKRKPSAPEKPRPWEQDSSADGLDLPGDDFDYGDFIEREFGRKPHRKTGLAWYWWLLAAVMLVVMAAWALGL